MWDVLARVGGFSVHLEIEVAVLLADDGDVEHVEPPLLLNFHRPLDVRVDAVEVCVEGLYVGLVYGCERVVGFPEPALDGVRCCGAWVLAVVVGDSPLFIAFHVCIRQWPAARPTYGET